MPARPEVAPDPAASTVAALAVTVSAAASAAAAVSSLDCSVDCTATVSMTGAASVVTAGRSNETVAVGAAVTASCAAWDPDSAEAEIPTLASAALAGMPTLRTRPEAAATTAAWRPTVPALALTALDTAPSGFLRTVCARWRAELWREDTKGSLSQCLRGELSDSDGSHPAALLPGKLCDLTPRPSCEDQNWFPRPCQTM